MADHRNRTKDLKSANHPSKTKKALAGAFVALMLTPAVAIPAYATAGAESAELSASSIADVSQEQIIEANLQRLQTAAYETDDSELAGDFAVNAELSAEWLAEQERLKKEKEAKEKAKAEAKARAEAEAKARAEAQREASAALEADATASAESVAVPPSSVDVPAGVGAQGVADAAIAQVGVAQDCTDLVQNSLAAAGYTARRDQGGYDLGTGVEDYDRFGSRVPLDALAPGDILIYGNAPSGTHVAIYIGNGQAVHGGFNGSTQIAGVHTAFQPLTSAVRPS